MAGKLTNLEQEVTPFGLAYTLIRTKRRSLGLYVHADGRVVVRAPYNYPTQSVESILSSRYQWIRKNQQTFLQQPSAPTPVYEDGQEIAFLGDTLTLCIKTGTKQGTQISLHGNELHIVTSHEITSEFIEKRIQRWYVQQAKIIFAERLALCVEHAAPLIKIKMPQLRIRRMYKRWGSCTIDQKITLNSHLVEFPMKYIDYVIYHELCHLRVFNHSKAFYKLMDEVCTNWKQLRQEMRQFRVV